MYTLQRPMIQIITISGVSGQTSCKKGYVKNGTECIKDPCKKGYVQNGTESECSICDTGYHRSLGKCVNTICFFIFISSCVIVVALLVISGLIMRHEKEQCRSIRNRSNSNH